MPHLVLLVDDDESVRSLLRMTLPTNAFEIAEARDGSEALTVASARRPDVVVLDWSMPGLSGEEVLTALKGRFPGLSVIVLTAKLDAAPRELAASLGADAFLTKPFSPLQLLDLIERLVAERAPDQDP